MKNIGTFHLKPKTKGIILGAITAFALSLVYLLQRKRQTPKHQNKPVPKIFNQEKLIMERYVFNLPDQQGDIEAVVENGGECYAVHLNGKYTGNMWQEEEKGGQWKTTDAALEPYLLEIAAKLSEAFSRNGFTSILKGTYPEIIRTDWKTSETLEVNIQPEADIEIFSTFLKDEVQNLVTFEEHLDLIVKKEDDPYFVLIGIN